MNTNVSQHPIKMRNRAGNVVVEKPRLDMKDSNDKNSLGVMDKSMVNSILKVFEESVVE